MLLGVDTGFFVSYANDHPRAVEIWQELVEGLHTLVVSTLTINEVLVSRTPTLLRPPPPCLPVPLS
jgi:predicted nucleic acid-binding protein